LRVAFCAVGILRGGHLLRGQLISPLDRLSVRIRRDIDLDGLERLVMVAVGVDATSGPALVLVSQPERRVAHLVERDLICARCSREDGDLSPGAPIGRAIYGNHNHGVLRDRQIGN
jgi:hypothetical protein